MNSRWTVNDLERFHDDDLPSERREALRADLMRDAALRERLAHVRAVDALVCDTLTGDSDRHAPGEFARVAGAHSRRRVSLGAWSALAATLFLAGAAAVYTLGRGGADRIDDTPTLVDAVETAPNPREGLLIARYERGATMHADIPDGAQSEGAPAPTTLRASFESMLDRGDLGGALALVLGADTDDLRAEAWVAIGERVRSGAAAEELLDALPASAQVDVIGAWALRPSLRPASFERLARLSATTDPDVRERVRALRDELSHHPDLRAWLLSYAAR